MRAGSCPRRTEGSWGILVVLESFQGLALAASPGSFLFQDYLSQPQPCISRASTTLSRRRTRWKQETEGSKLQCWEGLYGNLCFQASVLLSPSYSLKQNRKKQMSLSTNTSEQLRSLLVSVREIWKEIYLTACILLG